MRSKALCNASGLEITELSTHLQGQLVAVHPAYDELFDGFAPEAYRKNPTARQAWAVQQLKYAAKASKNLGLNAHATFSGACSGQLLSLAAKTCRIWWIPDLKNWAKDGNPSWMYLMKMAWIFVMKFIPGEDLHDGITYERFLEEVNNHPRACLLYDPSHFVLQQLDYLTYIDYYHERIRMFHVKDAEFNPTGKQGVYGGYQTWIDRAGRFRSLGDGQVDFKSIFSKLTQYDYAGWAVLEWECCIKHPEDGAKEGSVFIKNHIIRVTEKAFDDFAGTGSDEAFNRSVLGIK